MLKTCEMCANDFLTESDPYVVVPRPNKVIYYCTCMIVKGDEASELRKLRSEIEAYKKRDEEYLQRLSEEGQYE